jgi:8-oxo-dGTP pyrophosphatase MutT (NUDIX family)
MPPPRARYAINLIENERRELLLLRRAPDRKLGPGLWGFAAGNIEPGETPEHCSRREITEEIGPRHRLEALGRIGPVRDSYYGGTLEIHLFHYRWLGGSIVLNGEHTAYAWVGPESYRNYAVMDGIDEDIDLFGICPRRYLDPRKLPHAAGAGAKTRKAGV